MLGQRFARRAQGLDTATRRRLDESLMRAMPVIALALALIIAWAAWGGTHRIGTGAEPVFWADVIVAPALAVVGIGLWLVRDRPAFAHPGAFLVVALVATTATVAQASRTAVQPIDYVVLLLGAGIIFLDGRWLTAAMGVTWAGWLFATGNTLPMIDQPGDFILVVATVIGGLAFWSRSRALASMIEAEDAAERGREKAEAMATELERFASVIAHDLQNPVAAIRLKSATLARRIPARDMRSRDMVAAIERITDEMGEMITDVLAYAKGGGQAGDVGWIDMNQLARDTEEVFDDRLGQVGARMEIDELPRIHADETSVRQLLLNLVGNALHYRRDDVPLVISLAGSRLESGAILTVTDNGVGFEPEDAERLFLPGERSSVRPGHGLGLATCRRIVESLNGTIRAAALPDTGSVFTIFIPDDHTPDEEDEAVTMKPRERPPRPSRDEAHGAREAEPGRPTIAVQTSRKRPQP